MVCPIFGPVVGRVDGLEEQGTFGVQADKTPFHVWNLSLKLGLSGVLLSCHRRNYFKGLTSPRGLTDHVWHRSQQFGATRRGQRCNV
jgi:hypothetical protein